MKNGIKEPLTPIHYDKSHFRIDWLINNISDPKIKNC